MAMSDAQRLRERRGHHKPHEAGVVVQADRGRGRALPRPGGAGAGAPVGLGALSHRSYQQNNETLNVLLPLGALRFVRTLEALSRGAFVLLSADKAHAHEEDLRLTKENPHIAIHGSFSMMANFHALRQYFLARGGASFHTPYYTGLQVAAFALGAAPLDEFQFAWEVGRAAALRNRTCCWRSTRTASRSCSGAFATRRRRRR